MKHDLNGRTTVLALCEEASQQLVYVGTMELHICCQFEIEDLRVR